MTDDAVREIHGVKAMRARVDDSERIILREGETGITAIMGTEWSILTPWQARYLARKLYHLARRIESRQIEDEQ